METTNNISYTFIEKYFKVEPEGRIGRGQFFIRSIILGIIIFIPYAMLVESYLARLIFPRQFFDDGYLKFFRHDYVLPLIISVFIIALVTYFIIIPLVKKRCQDFGYNGKWATILLLTGIAAIITYTLFRFGILRKYIPSLITILLIYNIIPMIKFGLVILYSILLFRPGKKGDNQFGKDPVNTEVIFLG